MTGLLTLTQALQLVALAPCIFLIAFLLLVSRKGTQIITPVLYFTALACSFLLPLLDVEGWGPQDDFWRGIFMLGENIIPAVSFLLIIQFLQGGRIPPTPYWGVLLIPLVGGSSMVMATLAVDESCLFNDSLCMPSQDVMSLYHIVSALFIFLLLFLIFIRTTPTIDREDSTRRHKYWLVVTLIALNLLVLATELAKLARHTSPQEAMFIITMLRLGFIYLVLTSIFRVFDRSFAFDMSHVPVIKKYAPTDADNEIAQRVVQSLEQQHIYREMGLSREALATKLGLQEHQLSRAMNGVLRQSFSELINSHRIREAKQRLRNEKDVPITVIAFEVGFNSIASFNRVFKDLVGKSPTEYRTSEA